METQLQRASADGGGEILVPAEVAARLRVKTSWVYRHADDLGAYRVGKYLRFRWGRVLERLESTGLLGAEPNDPKIRSADVGDDLQRLR